MYNKNPMKFVFSHQHHIYFLFGPLAPADDLLIHVPVPPLPTITAACSDKP